jgi:hypothetical protein
MSNAYDALMGTSGDVEIGKVEIVGRRAIAVPESDNPQKFLEGKYTVADRISVGFPQNPATIGAGLQLQFVAQLSTPFKAEKMVIDSEHAADVSVMAIDVGPNRYVDGGPVPGALFSEVALDNFCSWDTVQTTVPIQITIRNDTAGPIAVKLGLRGLRLR